MLVVLMLYGAACPLPARAQAVEVNRSQTVQVINGRSFFVHPVAQGQTLFSIARAYGVSQDDILRANPELQEGLRFGQNILVPVSEPTQPQAGAQVRVQAQAPAPSQNFITHTVRRGETTYGIARHYGVSVDQIIALNPEAAQGIRQRQVLRIPRPEPPAQTHLVAAGETLFSISRKFAVSVDDLLNFNPGLTHDIRPGQLIQIPRQSELASREDQPEAMVFVQTPGEEEVAASPEDDAPCDAAQLKEQYQVALLIPLYLEGLDTVLEYNELARNHRSFGFIDYYKGVLLALDSVKTHRGVNIRLHVFDVDDNPGKARSAISSPGFSDMDLIIGPFHTQPLSVVAAFGQRTNIPVVSPLLADNKLLQGFPNLFQATPSLATQLDDLAAYISYTYTDQNIILVHNSQQQAVELINGFRQSLDRGLRAAMFHQDSLNLARVNGYFLNGSLVGHRRTNVMVINDSVLETRTGEVAPAEYSRQNPLREVIFMREGVTGVTRLLDPNKKNIIITLIGGEAFLADYLRQLNHDFREYDMIVFGLPDWQKYQNVDIEYLQNLKVHIFSSDYQDFRDAHTRDFVLRYRKIFNTEPGDYAFKGVQTAWFFFNALGQYGRSFPTCIQKLNSTHFQNPFHFSQSGSHAGFENKKSTLFRYENFRMIDARRPLLQAGE